MLIDPELKEMITPDLKGRVYFKNGKYHWVVKAPNGDIMGRGEERLHTHSFQNAYDLVLAIQTWMMFGRGDLLAQTHLLECDFVPRNRTCASW